MAIPDYQTLMRPLLDILADGQPRPLRELREKLADTFKLSAAEREQMLPSGGATLFADRVGWARYYLQRAGMLRQVRRSIYTITDAGHQLLREVSGPISSLHLRQRSPEFAAWVAGEQPTRPAEAPVTPMPDQRETPEELLSEAHAKLKRAVESDVLNRLRSCSPTFFEQIVVRLLVAMGYGGSQQDAGRAIGRTGDGGIDGLIDEDRLGLDTVYVQAKRWINTVGRPDIQQFAGALAGKRARKGVFITTSTFSPEAYEYITTIEPKIVLINGERLAQFMFEHNVGVSLATTYEVKKIEADFFDED
jgi:restriction system protein